MDETPDSGPLVHRPRTDIPYADEARTRRGPRRRPRPLRRARRRRGRDGRVSGLRPAGRRRPVHQRLLARRSRPAAALRLDAARRRAGAPERAGSRNRRSSPASPSPATCSSGIWRSSTPASPTRPSSPPARRSGSCCSAGCCFASGSRPTCWSASRSALRAARPCSPRAFELKPAGAIGDLFGDRDRRFLRPLFPRRPGRAQGRPPPRG